MPLPINTPLAPFFLLNTVGSGTDGANVATLVVYTQNTSAGNTTAAQVSAGMVANTLPNTAAQAASANMLVDNVGRQVFTPIAPRSLIFGSTNAVQTTAETTIIQSAGAGIFNDITNIILTNGSATATTVSFRDSAAGSVKFTLLAPATSTVNLSSISPPLIQSAAATLWTVQCSTAVTNLTVFTQFTQNRL